MPAKGIHCALALALLASPVVHAGMMRQLGPHVHGISHLDIALDGKTLDVSLSAPGQNIIGFEHPPYTPPEHRQLDAAMAMLKTPARWFSPAAQAHCSLVEMTVEPHGYAANDKPATEADDHTDIDAHYRYRCEMPAGLDKIDVALADCFPETHQIVVDLVTANRQDQQILQDGQHRVVLAP
jgi:hypothetical protein